MTGQERGDGVSQVEQIFLECERARAQGLLIQKVSNTDKEYHFQNWVQDRLDACHLQYDQPGRNVYPDFRLVNHPEGYEVKGLAWPGREANYDSNSQVPSGRHRGRDVYYVFGRYPKETTNDSEYPVTDLVVCHGNFLNADSGYAHKNRSFQGFGSYGDIMVRDRKMYVVPTPFALVAGTVGLATLIAPEGFVSENPNLICVGDLVRAEAKEIIVGYEFDLTTNVLAQHRTPNPNAGRQHRFKAYRSRGQGEKQRVTLTTATVEIPHDE